MLRAGRLRPGTADRIARLECDSPRSWARAGRAGVPSGPSLAARCPPGSPLSRPLSPRATRPGSAPAPRLPRPPRARVPLPQARLTPESLPPWRPQLVAAQPAPCRPARCGCAPFRPQARSQLVAPAVPPPVGRQLSPVSATHACSSTLRTWWGPKPSTPSAGAQPR